MCRMWTRSLQPLLWLDQRMAVGGATDKPGYESPVRCSDRAQLGVRHMACWPLHRPPCADLATSVAAVTGHRLGTIAPDLRRED